MDMLSELITEREPCNDIVAVLPIPDVSDDHNLMPPETA